MITPDTGWRIALRQPRPLPPAVEAGAITPQIARPPLSLRISVTDRCSLRCTYCTPPGGVPKTAGERVLTYPEILVIVRELAARFGLAQVRLTGGEPLLRPDIDKLIAMLAAEGLPDLALTTNGQQLAGVAARLKQAGLTRVNISLDALDPGNFAAITRGGILNKTVAGIAAAHQAGLRPVKLNVVVMRGRNDGELAGLVRFAIQHDCQVRFLELMPIGVAAAWFDDRFVSSSEVRDRLSAEFTLTALPVDPHSTSRSYMARDRHGRSAIVGFVSPYSEPFCVGCWRLRLTAAGVLIGCLARSGRIPLAPLLRGGRSLDSEALAAAVEKALNMKRRNGEFVQPQAMVGIGG